MIQDIQYIHILFKKKYEGILGFDEDEKLKEALFVTLGGDAASLKNRLGAAAVYIYLLLLLIKEKLEVIRCL